MTEQQPKDNSPPRPDFEKIRKDAVDCTISLCKAIQEAGGAISLLDEIEHMSVMDFMVKVAAQNGIRFHFEKMPEQGCDATRK